ncbi:MAG: hypothetical protein FWF98_00850 [Dehalococcoidia bacterium]|nr:hypothetical protein [Dehalococcoidia bacterium]
MLAKLIKYEFKATGRYFLPLFGTMLAIALINRLFQLLTHVTRTNLATPQAISISLSQMLFTAIMAVALVITIQRFNKNLLQNEGYLSFTLPVKVEHLILSKLLTSFTWYIANAIVLVISMLLAYSINMSFSDITNFFNDIFNLWFSSGESFLIGVELIIVSILGTFSSILLIYTCLSLSMLVNNHRWLLAFGMYFAFSTIEQLFASFAAVSLILLLSDSSWSPFAISQLVASIGIVFLLTRCIGLFSLTLYMLRRRLNLL